MRIYSSSYKTFTSLLISLCLNVFSTPIQAETQFQSQVQTPVESNKPLGRLFSKPHERNNLNILRQNQKQKNLTPQDAQKDVVIETTPAELPDPITLQGYVKRNDGGTNTLWINGKAVQEDSKVDSVNIGKLNQRGFSQKGASTEGVDVKIPANGKQIRLKAGQMYAPEDNKIYEMQVVEKAKRLNLEQRGVIDGGDEKPQQ